MYKVDVDINKSSKVQLLEQEFNEEDRKNTGLNHTS